jgi:DNA-binding transcriptional regulator LsrR (DeoR family)
MYKQLHWNVCADVITKVTMPAPRNPDLLAKAARLYFVEDRSQSEVAATLGTTRSNVSRMLRQARELGIVQIRILSPAQRDNDLEQVMRRRFGLADARILAVGPDTDVMAGVGRLAAGWLLETLRDDQVVALSWGSTLHAMVRAVDGARQRNIVVVQLVGGLSALESQVSGQELVRELAERMGAHHRYLHAPALLGSAEAVGMMLREPAIADALAAAKAADVAMVGIGTRGLGSSAALIDSLALTDRERAQFEASGAVGDVCGRFFDLDGEEPATVVAERVLAVSLDDLRRIPTVAGVAAGQAKAPGILGALRGRVVDVLVCDETACRAVLALDQRPAA